METDRRLRAALLPYQPRLLHDVLDSLDVAVVVLDESSRVLAANVAASRMLGISRGRRAGDSPPARVRSITADSGAEVDVSNYDEVRAFALAPPTLRVELADGEVRWLAATVQRLADSLSDGDAVVCRYTDVTVRRELERRAAAAGDRAARAEIDLVAAEQRVALLEELLVHLSSGRTDD